VQQLLKQLSPETEMKVVWTMILLISLIFLIHIWKKSKQSKESV
jgi:cytochrome c1